MHRTARFSAVQYAQYTTLHVAEEGIEACNNVHMYTVVVVNINKLLLIPVVTSSSLHLSSAFSPRFTPFLVSRSIQTT